MSINDTEQCVVCGEKIEIGKVGDIPCCENCYRNGKFKTWEENNNKNKSRTHHEFSPSQLKCLDLCPGRWKLSKLVPPAPQSPAASEGEMLHEVVEKLYPVHPGVRTERDIYKALTEEQKLLVDKTLELLDKMDGDWKFEEELSITDDEFNVITSGYIDCNKVEEK